MQMIFEYVFWFCNIESNVVFMHADVFEKKVKSQKVHFYQSKFSKIIGFGYQVSIRINKLQILPFHIILTHEL